jgi:hypothetical protein
MYNKFEMKRNNSDTEILMDRRNVLNVDNILRKAPSIFASNPHKDRSSQYHFIPTIEVLNIFEKQGWLPVKAMEQRVNKEDKAGFQKHIIRLRNFNKNLTFNGSCVELVLVNSHDGSCAYQLHAGVFRLVCLNGMVIGDSLFPRIRVRHQGFQDQDFIDVSYKVIQDVPKITAEINTFNTIELLPEEKEAYAKSALTLRYEDLNDAPIAPNQLLKTRRIADSKNDLYTTYNIVQENIIKGGLLGRNKKGQYRRTREIKSINEDIRLNKALWTLTEQMKQLKAA